MKRIALFLTLSVVVVCLCGCQQSPEDAAGAEVAARIALARKALASADAMASIAPKENLPAFKPLDVSGKALLTDAHMEKIDKAVAADAETGGNSQVLAVAKVLAKEIGLDLPDLSEAPVDEILSTVGTKLLADEKKGRQWGWAMANPRAVSAWTVSAANRIEQARVHLTAALGAGGIGDADLLLVLTMLGDLHLKRARLTVGDVATAEAALTKAQRDLLRAVADAKRSGDALAAVEAGKLAERIAELRKGLPEDALPDAGMPLVREALAKGLDTLRTEEKQHRGQAKTDTDAGVAKAREAVKLSTDAATLARDADKVRIKADAAEGDAGQKLFDQAAALRKTAAEKEKKSEELDRESKQLQAASDKQAARAAGLRQQYISRARMIVSMLPKSLMVDAPAELTAVELAETDCLDNKVPQWLEASVAAAMKGYNAQLASLRTSKDQALAVLGKKAAAVREANLAVGREVQAAAASFEEALTTFLKVGGLAADVFAKARLSSENTAEDGSFVSSGDTGDVSWVVSGKAGNTQIALASRVAAAAEGAGKLLDRYAFSVAGNTPLAARLEALLPGEALIADLPKATGDAGLVPVTVTVNDQRLAAVKLLRGAAKFQWLGAKQATGGKKMNLRLDMLLGNAETYLALHNLYKGSGLPGADLLATEHRARAKTCLTTASSLDPDKRRQDVADLLELVNRGT